MLANRYRLEAKIAAGGMGEVWRAADLVLARPVAVKLLRHDYAIDDEGRERFRAEARHAGSVSHPNIAQVYDFREGVLPGISCLVMELVPGPSLAAMLDSGPLECTRTLAVVAETAAGLAAAHAAGLVHRDIKPGNLLIGPDGTVKITDFGIAVAMGAVPVTRTGVLLGTPAYLAPERAAGRSATPATDVYSLGVVAYQCLAGRPPFEGEPLVVAVTQAREPLPPLPPWVPLPVAELVAALTAKDPLARPSSAAVAEHASLLKAFPHRAAIPRPRQSGEALPGAAVPMERPATPRAAGSAWNDPVGHRPDRPTQTQRLGSGASRPRQRTGAALLAVLLMVAGLTVAVLSMTTIGAPGSGPPPAPAATAGHASGHRNAHPAPDIRPVADDNSHPGRPHQGRTHQKRPGGKGPHHPPRGRHPRPTPPGHSPKPTAPGPSPSPVPSTSPSPAPSASPSGGAPSGAPTQPGPGGH